MYYYIISRTIVHAQWPVVEIFRYGILCPVDVREKPNFDFQARTVNEVYQITFEPLLYISHVNAYDMILMLFYQNYMCNM